MALIEGRVMPFMLDILEVANQKDMDVEIAMKINIARAYTSISSNSKCCQVISIHDSFDLPFVVVLVAAGPLFEFFTLTLLPTWKSETCCDEFLLVHSIHHNPYVPLSNPNLLLLTHYVDG